MSYEGNEEFWFRFVSLSIPQVNALRQHCEALEVRSRRNALHVFIASFRLKAGGDYDWLPSFVKEHNIADSSYGIFISLVTKHDSEIVTLPSFVLELYRHTGGQMEFSFTVVSDPP